MHHLLTQGPHADDIYINIISFNKLQLLLYTMPA